VLPEGTARAHPAAGLHARWPRPLEPLPPVRTSWPALPHPRLDPRHRTLVASTTRWRVRRGRARALGASTRRSAWASARVSLSWPRAHALHSVIDEW